MILRPQEERNAAESRAPPFVVLANARCRTYWLSKFLSYREWICGHDELIHCRTLDDAAAWFKQPSVGTAETALAPFWRLLIHNRPSAKIVVVRRPIDEVLASLARQGVAGDHIGAIVKATDRKLRQIERRVPGVLSVRFEDLAREDECAAAFEHCLGLPHDRSWWRRWSGRNVSGDIRAQVRYCQAYRPQLEKLARAARQRSLAMMQRPAMTPDVFDIQEEDIDTWFRSAEPLLVREHMIATGQDVEDFRLKNEPLLRRLAAIGALQIITARSNGRMFAYLLTLIGPSLDAEDRIEALHLPFFVSPDCPGLGLGMKLQRAAIEGLRDKGVTDVLARAGVRGAGPRLGSMYRRLGFEELGTMHRLELEPARQPLDFSEA